MSCFSVLQSHALSRAALAAASSAFTVSAALAQTALPPVVVEGATRAVRPPQESTVEPAARPAPDATPATPQQKRASPRPAPTGTEATATDLPAAGEPARANVEAGLLQSNQGTSSTVLTADDLASNQVRAPADALRGLPGVTVGRTGGFGGLGQVRIRGAEGRHTTVLIDGIEANNPADGEFDFSNLLAGDEIERIEVLRGPQSGLYGSGAMGGVINVVTKSGRGPLTLTGRAEYGAFNTRDVGATLSAGNTRAWGLLGVQTRRTDGFNIARAGSERDGAQTTSSIAKAGFSPIEGLSFEGVLRHTSKRGDRDEEDFQTPGVLLRQVDAPSRFSSDFWVGALEGKLALLGGAWVQSVRAERRSIVNDDLSINPAFPDFPNYDRYRANAETLRYTSTLRLDTPGLPQVRHFVTGMLEAKREGFVQYTSDNLDRERSFRSYVGEVRGEYWNSLFLSGSYRQDDSDRFGEFATWRATASLKLPGTPVRLHSSYGTGVKFPSLFEQYGRVPLFFSPNPNLRPETSKGWDAGVELSFLGGRAVVDATRFETEFRDKIRFVNSVFPGTSVNDPGTSLREGYEFSGRVVPLPGLTLSASYTLLDARDPQGIQEIRRPRHSGRIEASYTFLGERARIGVSAIYNGTMRDEALRAADPFIFPLTPERVNLKEYWLVAATASYKLTPQMEIYGRVENLLDQRYEEIYGFGTPGLAAYGGLRIRLQDQSTPLPPR